MIDFLRYLAKGDMTSGEKELAYHLTVIYGLSILSMVVLYRLFYSSSGNTAKENTNLSNPTKGCHQLPTIEDTMMLIKSRRTIMPKDLNGEKLSNDQIETLLEAANWAPTHKTTEPWRFTVITGSEKILEYLEF